VEQVQHQKLLQVPFKEQVVEEVEEIQLQAVLLVQVEVEQVVQDQL
jgi:hypothetical protein